MTSLFPPAFAPEPFAPLSPALPFLGGTLFPYVSRCDVCATGVPAAAVGGGRGSARRSPQPLTVTDGPADRFPSAAGGALFPSRSPPGRPPAIHG
ncbi:hypothetical protein GCM10009605_56250 [Nocardiopsis composta]